MSVGICTQSPCERPLKGRGLCENHLAIQRRRRRGIGPQLRGLEGFWAKVDKAATTSGCWLWTGAMNPKGYGRYGKPTRYAHRIAYQALVGPIPEDMTLDHLCRVRNCVNPAHLEVVTRAVNTSRGRRHASDRHLHAVAG